MRIRTHHRRRSEQGSIIAYFVILMVLISAIASVSALVSQTLTVTHRRNDMISSTELAEGGAALACAEFETAFNNTSASLTTNLVKNAAGAYSLISGLSNSQTNVYQRVITQPFSSGQSWVPS